MVEKIFIDSSAFIAISDKSDQYHFEASQYLLTQINNLSIIFYTSNLIIAETYTRILYKTHFKLAQKFLDIIVKSDIAIIYSDDKIENSAKKYLVKYPKLKLSYIDAVSFSIMKMENIQSSFSFDKHFEIIGFQLRPVI